MQVVLVMFRADGERRSFSVVRDMTVIGRREDCDLRIPLGDVSRKHCRLIRDGDTIRIEDLGSSNGTYHNGVRIQEAELSPGDVIRVGPVDFVVQIDGVPADDELQPAAAAPAGADSAMPEQPLEELEELEEVEIPHDDLLAHIQAPAEEGGEGDLVELESFEEPEQAENAAAARPAAPAPAEGAEPEFEFTLEEQDSEADDSVDFNLEESPEKKR